MRLLFVAFICYLLNTVCVIGDSFISLRVDSFSVEGLAYALNYDAPKGLNPFQKITPSAISNNTGEVVFYETGDSKVLFKRSVGFIHDAVIDEDYRLIALLSEDKRSDQLTILNFSGDLILSLNFVKKALAIRPSKLIDIFPLHIDGYNLEKESYIDEAGFICFSSSSLNNLYAAANAKNDHHGRLRNMLKEFSVPEGLNRAYCIESTSNNFYWYSANSSGEVAKFTKENGILYLFVYVEQEVDSSEKVGCTGIEPHRFFIRLD